MFGASARGASTRVTLPRRQRPLAEISDYAWLIGDQGAAWLTRLADDVRPQLQQLESLRRELPVERARLVVEQVELRRRAVEKFGELAAQMFFTRMLLEQATDLGIARYKAQRLAAGGPAALGDYCCGAGGDLLAMAERGPATGWDRSEIACLLAAANLRGSASVRCGDVEQGTPADGEAWHLDPDRRPSGRRSTAMDHYAPGPELVERWRLANPRGSVKLAPAAVAPPSWQSDVELEWITHDRECRQQVAWFGQLAAAAGRRRATLIRPDGAQATFIGAADLPCQPADEPASFLYDPDPSILAAGLLGALAEKYELSSLGIGAAYLTGDECVIDPLAAGFAAIDCLPLRTASLAAYFAKRSVGRLEIKKRGVAIEPEALRRQLKLRGDNAATVVLTRIGRREAAIVVERFPA
jgi:hypothetical protein